MAHNQARYEVSVFDITRPLKRSEIHARDLVSIFRLFDMGLGCVPEEFDSNNRDNLDEARDAISGGGEYFIVREAGSRSPIIAMAHLDTTPDDKGEVELLALAVEPEHRGKGVGTLLAQAVLAQAQSQGATLITGDVPFKGIGFVAKFGHNEYAESWGMPDLGVRFTHQIQA